MLRCAQNASGNPETLQALLEMEPGLKVPEEVLVAFTKSENMILNVVLGDNRELEVTDAVVERALEIMEYDETMSRLLDRHRSKKISSQIPLGAV